MTNDILEQITEDYLREDGYFTQHNISYRPKNFNQHPSDIDIIAVHPTMRGIKRVVVVSCKSWHLGVNIKTILKVLSNKSNSKAGKNFKKRFREIVDDNWSTALKEKVFELTGQRNFTFYISATHFIGNRKEWEKFGMFRKNLKGCEIKTLDFKDMVNHIWPKLTKIPAHSSLSRILQLAKASGGNIGLSSQKV